MKIDANRAYLLFVGQKMADLMMSLLENKDMNTTVNVFDIIINYTVSTVQSILRTFPDERKDEILHECQTELNEGFNELRNTLKLPKSDLKALDLRVNVDTRDVKKIYINNEEHLAIGLPDGISADECEYVSFQLKKIFKTDNIFVHSKSMEIDKK